MSTLFVESTGSLVCQSMSLAVMATRLRKPRPPLPKKIESEQDGVKETRMCRVSLPVCGLNGRLRASPSDCMSTAST